VIKKYNYIITGAGCAGLSLLRRMMQHPFFSNKKILLVDKKPKTANDKTWCFWEQEPGVFEDVVYHRWQQIDFYSDFFSARFDLKPYEYKMIRSVDFYQTVLNEAKQHSNIEILFEDIQSVFSNESYAVVKTKENEFHSDFVFNSIIFYDWKKLAMQQKHTYVLLQHFKGWLIEADENCFDEGIATFMDFRIDQTNGTTFVYVLPVEKNKALIEFTLFSENLLEVSTYEAAIANYIQSFLQIKNYTITHKEFGVIPMTNFKFSKGENRVINMGIAGNDTKASSGYTFQFIQKHTAKIIDALLNQENPLSAKTIFEKRFQLYDRILLNVLYNKKMSGDKLFAELFKKNPVQSILKFLDNESSFKEELKIMNSVPLVTFLPAALKEIFH